MLFRKMRGCKGFNIIFIPSTFTNSKQFRLIALCTQPFPYPHLTPANTQFFYMPYMYACIHVCGCVCVCERLYTLKYKELTKVDPITNLKQFIFDSVRIKLYVFIPFIPFSCIISHIFI